MLTCSGLNKMATMLQTAFWNWFICKPMTGEFPAQRASNAENVSILMTSSCTYRSWWRNDIDTLSSLLAACCRPPVTGVFPVMLFLLVLLVLTKRWEIVESSECDGMSSLTLMWRHSNERQIPSHRLRGLAIWHISFNTESTNLDTKTRLHRSNTAPTCDLLPSHGRFLKHSEIFLATNRQRPPPPRGVKTIK